MFRVRRSLHLFCVVPVAAVLLLAADAPWKVRAIPEWTGEDARELLTESPWAKTVTAMIRRMPTEFERRDGGHLGQPHGVGFDGIDGKPANPKAVSSHFGGPAGAHPLSPYLTLQLRWETALPIRLAEMKIGMVEPPTLPGDGYSLAVYGVPGGGFKGDPKTLGDPLKDTAVLKREGKSDVRPVSVEVFETGDGLVVVYRFPLSAEITKQDGTLKIDAQIGRISFVQSFDAAEMQFQGKLQL